MKILYVITKSECGGAQVHLLDLIENLPTGCCPMIVTGEKGFLCEEAEKLGVPIRYVPELAQPINVLKDFRALLAIMRVVREVAPDIIHAHTSKAGLLARFAARLTGTPVVFTAHTWSFADGLPWLQRLIAVPLERLAAATGTIITVSEANTAIAVEKSIRPEKDITRIWNGVPDTAGRATPGSRHKLVLMTAARFAPQKDHLLLLEALQTVEGDWRLLLVGDGPTRPQVEQAVKRMGLTDRIEFLGLRDDIGQLMANADVFVLPSKWEGLPLSILEAMRAGLPVIATNTGGVAEAVTDGVTGYLTAPGDAAQLSGRIQTLIDSRHLLSSMGWAARRRYEQDFKIDVMVRKTVAVYKQVLTEEAMEFVAGEVRA
jgi:glycosyltransferase involved in cell wall biosynthesis